MPLSGKKQGRNSADTAPRSEAGARYSARQVGSRKASGKLRMITAQALDGRTRAAQSFNQIVTCVTSDLGGADRLSEIEKHLVTSFAGAAILQSHQLTHLLAGGTIDAHEYASVTASMIRSATRLGTERRPRDTTPDLATYLRSKAEANEAAE